MVDPEEDKVIKDLQFVIAAISSGKLYDVVFEDQKGTGSAIEGAAAWQGQYTAAPAGGSLRSPDLKKRRSSKGDDMDRLAIH
jgi:hypothetical protein